MLWTLAACWCALSGCAALTVPVTGIPVEQVRPELLGESRELQHALDLTLLRQKSPKVYLLGPKDVLGIWIDGVLGEREQLPVKADTAQAVGLPFRISEDGTLALPLIDPVPLSGLSLKDAEAAIRQAYQDRRILQPNLQRVIVSLIRARTVKVLVVRQDREVNVGVDEEITRPQRRGSGEVLELPAYENDVLNAMIRTGGLPGLDGYNEIFIERGGFRAERAGEDEFGIADYESHRSVRIPLRVTPGEPLPFEPADIILHDGDVVYVEARDIEVFYTGGLLPTGEHVLPRDYDIDVLEAISRQRGPLVSGGLQTNFFFPGSPIEPGIGGPSPSLVIILRRTPGGGQVPIRVDLNKAIRDPRERILIQAGDMVILQQTPGEALARYTGQMVNLVASFRLWDRGDSTGVGTVIVP